MPIYEYQCTACGHLFEEWCKQIDNTETASCPQCSQESRRLISHTSFALKGEGWYVTEYGNRKKSTPQETSKPAESSSAAAAPDSSVTTPSPATA